jgi:signal transduction histidine kinase
VSTTAGAGVQVNVARIGERRDVPAGIDQAAFRIVQEALTNVVKHSGASACGVSVGYEPTSLSVEVIDHGAGPAKEQDRSLVAREPNGTGHGILGMRERVSLHAGEFSAGPLPERGFRVAAQFPLPAVAEKAPQQETLPRQAIPGAAR